MTEDSLFIYIVFNVHYYLMAIIVVISPQFMDLRTRYTALVTFTTQHVKYISDALRRLEEEEVGFSLVLLLLLPQNGEQFQGLTDVL